MASFASTRLQVSNLSVSRQNRTILRGVNLDVAQGEAVCITGPSGCGKSTLLRVLSLLERYDFGQILLDGVSIESFAFAKYRRQVSMLLQDAPMFAGTVADNLRFGPALVGNRLDDATVRGLLERVSLPGSMMQRDASELSGGERQRVALARSLANNPSVLLLDEPTSALDPTSAAEVITQLRRLTADGLSVIGVMHVPEHVRLMGGRVLKVFQGQLVDEALA